ncbi:flavin reductase family protein [Streptomyces sp. NPDC056987]|uniref:flavin reductase family protein n=1 Tax=Streptomyces sp. NPDC056987 TaxID=3345988 RepID=UPI00362964F5
MGTAAVVRDARLPVRQDPAERRRGMYHLASPVSVLTVATEERTHGTTASTVTLVSRTPLLVGVVLRTGSSFVGLAAREGRFAINVLAGEQADVARWFADSGRPQGSEQFDGLSWQPDTYAKAPLLAGALAHYSCRFHSQQSVGDGELILGHVVRVRTADGPPLLSYAGGLYAGHLRAAPEKSAT